MSNIIKDLLEKVKAAFDAPVVVPAAAPAAPVALATDQKYTLKDGTEISIAIKDPATNAEPSAGDMVTVAGAPAPEGEHELMDGTKITVDATGAITSIMEAPTPAEPAPMPETDLAARVAILEAELEKMRQPVTQMESEATKLALAKVEKQDEVIKRMFELVEQLVKLPTADPTTLPENKKSKFQAEKEKNEKKFLAIGEALKDTKKY